MHVRVLAHGLAPCRQCHKPVSAPYGLLRRELFHLSRCPHCGASNPHPQEVKEAHHTLRTALYGSVVLVASVVLMLIAPFEQMV